MRDRWRRPPFPRSAARRDRAVGPCPRAHNPHRSAQDRRRPCVEHGLLLCARRKRRTRRLSTGGLVTLYLAVRLNATFGVVEDTRQPHPVLHRNGDSKFNKQIPAFSALIASAQNQLAKSSLILLSPNTRPNVDYRRFLQVSLHFGSTASRTTKRSRSHSPRCALSVTRHHVVQRSTLNL